MAIAPGIRAAPRRGNRDEQFDPGRTTLRDRLEAKAAELGLLGGDASPAGDDGLLRRGLVGLVDRSPHPVGDGRRGR